MHPAPVTQVTYQTMVDVAETWVRDAVMVGRLRPGSRVAQDEIANELGISRMPLREALRRLEAQGFVTIRPHRGAFVAELSTDDIKSTYFVRTVLESASARVAASRFDEARGEQLRSILNAAREALAAGEGVRLAELNRAFHLAGHAATGNRVLIQLIEDLAARCQRYRLLHAGLSTRPEIALLEHEAILDAWVARDAEAAGRAIEINLRNSEEALLAAFTSMNEVT
jgi:DNA-binding GntR family transcriptional regulator